MRHTKSGIINSTYIISDQCTRKSTIIHSESDQYKCSSDTSKSTHIHTSEEVAEQLPEPQIELEIDSHYPSNEMINSEVDCAEQSARNKRTDASEIDKDHEDIVIAENPISHCELGECEPWPNNLQEDGNYIEGSSDNDRIDSTDAEKTPQINNLDSLESVEKQNDYLEPKYVIDHSGIGETGAAECGNGLDKGDIESRGESEYSTHGDLASGGGGESVFEETRLGSRPVKTDSAVASPEGKDSETFHGNEELQKSSSNMNLSFASIYQSPKAP
ncbi:MAG: hypothetical protein MHMPM18_002605 [Marteilia pararefringens]